MDLSLARPRSRLCGLSSRMSAVLRRRPEQGTDPGVFAEIEQEMRDSLKLAAGQATYSSEMIDNPVIDGGVTT